MIADFLERAYIPTKAIENLIQGQS